MKMLYHYLHNELWKLFGKKRTYIGFGAFLLAQNAMLLGFKFTRWQSDVERLLAGNGYLASQYLSTLTVAVFMLLPQVLLLMPLYAALVGGDLGDVRFDLREIGVEGHVDGVVGGRRPLHVQAGLFAERPALERRSGTPPERGGRAQQPA